MDVLKTFLKRRAFASPTEGTLKTCDRNELPETKPYFALRARDFFDLANEENAWAALPSSPDERFIWSVEQDAAENELTEANVESMH